jgi:muconolactone delta-isomerase
VREGAGMEILAVCRRRLEAFAEEEFLPLLETEAEALRRLYARGVVRAAWSREDVLGACMLLEAENVEQARAFLQELPLLAREMIEAQIIPLRGYRGFGPRQ